MRRIFAGRNDVERVLVPTGGHALPGLDQHVHFALLLTLFTGLSTGIGSLLGLFNRSFNPLLLTLSLSFSAGVMIQVSFLEIFPKARNALSAVLGARAGYVWTTIAFFAGIALMAALDQMLPSLRFAGVLLELLNCGRWGGPHNGPVQLVVYPGPL